jgi:hypothetical protein
VLDLGKRTGIKVKTDVAAAVRKTRPQIAVLCTSSALNKV